MLFDYLSWRTEYEIYSSVLVLRSTRIDFTSNESELLINLFAFREYVKLPAEWIYRGGFSLIVVKVRIFSAAVNEMSFYLKEIKAIRFWNFWMVFRRSLPWAFHMNLVLTFEAAKLDFSTYHIYISHCQAEKLKFAIFNKAIICTGTQVWPIEPKFCRKPQNKGTF